MAFLDFSGPRKKWAHLAQEDFFLLIQTLPTFWAERIWILRISFFGFFWGPKFLAWAQLGPTHLGPSWSHPLGPHVGPPTWAPRGPTLLGPGLGPGAGAAGRILRSQPDPSPNAPRDQIRRKDPCCDISRPLLGPETLRHPQSLIPTIFVIQGNLACS